MNPPKISNQVVLFSIFMSPPAICRAEDDLQLSAVSGWQRGQTTTLHFTSQHAPLALIWAGQGAGCAGSAVAAGGAAAAAAAGPPPCCGSVGAVSLRCWSSRPPRRRGRSSRSVQWRTRWRPGSAWWSTACPCSRSRAAWAWARSRWTDCRLSSGLFCYAGSLCGEIKRFKVKSTLETTAPENRWSKVTARKEMKNTLTFYLFFNC